MSEIPLHLVILGHVDHGKSTLLGRLLYELNALPEGRIEALRAMVEKQGKAFEFAYLLDALEEEQRQGITIDISQFRAKCAGREILFIDAPGHQEFLKNMISGASRADAALLLLDVNEGMREQSRLHAVLIQLLGIKNSVVLLNKMDLVNYREEIYLKLKAEYSTFFEQMGMKGPEAYIPISAKNGEGIFQASSHMTWYRGPNVVESISHFSTPPLPNAQAPVRFPIQDIYKFDDRRLVVGKLEAGELRTGDELCFWPAHSRAKIKSIEVWNSPSPQKVAGGQSISLVLDKAVYLERGYVGTRATEEQSLWESLNVTLFWLSRDAAAPGSLFKIKIATQETIASITSIQRVWDTDQLAERVPGQIRKHEIADATFALEKPLWVDLFADCEAMGRFVLTKNDLICGVGVVKNRQAHAITFAAHDPAKGMIIWLTGLSGAGKSTLSAALYDLLRTQGKSVFQLDGDTLRTGLCSDLGFSPKDRKENIRRAGEVAALLAQSGMIVIASFISPFRADRRRAREAAKDLAFIETYVDCPIEICEERDAKGLYQKTRSGKLADFTGVSSPYEIPIHPQLHLRADLYSVRELAHEVLNYLSNEKHLS